MGKHFKKYIFLLIVLIGLLVVGYLKYPKTSNNNENIEQASEENEFTEELEPEITPSTIDLERALNYISYNIADISPIKPVLGGSWHVVRMWAAEETIYSQDIQLYAEYEDGHIMRKVLLTVSVGGGETAHKVEAVFEPGEADWQIIQGEDIAFGKSLFLYEKNDQNGEWVKK